MSMLTKFLKGFKHNVVKPVNSELRPCELGQDILFRNSIEPLVREILSYVSAPRQYRDLLYFDLLQKTAELCQSQPLQENDTDYSFFSAQLEKTLNALKIRQGLLLPLRAHAEKVASEEPRWSYAIFSSALLMDIYKLALDREITLHYPDGRDLSKWSILSGAMYDDLFPLN